MNHDNVPEGGSPERGGDTYVPPAGPTGPSGAAGPGPGGGGSGPGPDPGRGGYPPAGPGGAAAPPPSEHVWTAWHGPATPPLPPYGPPPPPAPAARPPRRGRLVAGIAALALVCGGVGGAVGVWAADRDEPRVSVGDIPTGPDRPRDSVAGLASQALPGVVYLHVGDGTSSSTGTGFILDQAGHIITNNHVVAGEGEIRVTFGDGQETTARIVGRDTGYDLAVVKVEGVSGLHPLPLGNSDGVQVGDPVIAIGAPFDLEGTVTAGIISAKERAVSAGGTGSDVAYISALQTDAPINPGNSGGPLIDATGRVIGINAAIRSAAPTDPFGGEQAGSIGLGFAIPINQAERVARQLIETGKAIHPVIGVTVDVTYEGDGARITEQPVDGRPPVRQDGPADRAGLKPGDVIIALDGKRVRDANEFIVALRSRTPGETVQVTVRHPDGSVADVKVTLEGSSEGG